MDDRPPQCPKAKEVEDLIGEIYNELNEEIQQGSELSESEEWFVQTLRTALPMLEWLQNYLETRAFHHRKSTLKNTIRKNLLLEAFPESEKEVTLLAGKAAEDEIINS